VRHIDGGSAIGIALGLKLYLGGLQKNVTRMSAHGCISDGDLNGDFKNDFADLAILRQAYKQVERPEVFFEAAFLF
jgi:hypothetical protein